MRSYLDKFKTIYCVGDCYTAGQDFERKYGYPYFLQLLLGEGYIVENLGRANIQICTILDYPAQFIPENPAYKSCTILWCGTNDIYLNLITQDEIFNKYVELTDLMEKRDLSVFHMSMLRRYDTPIVTEKIFEEKRKIFNKKLLDKYLGNVLDIANELPLSKYFKSDREHLSYEGYKQVGKKCFKFLKEKGF